MSQIITQRFTKTYFCQKGTSPANPGAYFLVESAGGKMLGGIVLIKMTSNIKELFELSSNDDFGTVKGVLG